MRRKLFVIIATIVAGLAIVSCGKKKENSSFTPIIEQAASIEKTDEQKDEKPTFSYEKSEETIDTKRPMISAEVKKKQSEEQTEENGTYVFVMPDFVGKSIDSVMIDLAGYDIDIAGVEYQLSDIEKGTVIGQSVKAGEEVERGISLYLTVSKNIKSIKVPNVVGSTVDEAKKTLREYGLKTDTSLLKDELISYQNYKPGDAVAPGTVISLK